MIRKVTGMINFVATGFWRVLCVGWQHWNWNTRVFLSVCKYLSSERLSKAVRVCAVSYLRGGKSTFNRGLLHNFYHRGWCLSSDFWSEELNVKIGTWKLWKLGDIKINYFYYLCIKVGHIAWNVLDDLCVT